MPPIGKVTLTLVGTDLTASDEAGVSYVIHNYGAGKGVLGDIDPRIDLTQPIFEQVMKLQQKSVKVKHKDRAKTA